MPRIKNADSKKKDFFTAINSLTAKQKLNATLTTDEVTCIPDSKDNLYRPIFESIDRESCGYIDSRELNITIAKHFPHELFTTMEIDSLIKANCVSMDGFISLSEFVQIMVVAERKYALLSIKSERGFWKKVEEISSKAKEYVQRSNALFLRKEFVVIIFLLVIFSRFCKVSSIKYH